MSNQEKKEVINQVMHLLRCGEISSATPNKDVWKHFTFNENSGDSVWVCKQEFGLDLFKTQEDAIKAFWNEYHNQMHRYAQCEVEVLYDNSNDPEPSAAFVDVQDKHAFTIYVQLKKIQ